MPPSASIEELLLIETSRRNTDMVADLVFQRPDLFSALVSIYLRDKEPVSRRAAWVVDTVTEKRPELLTPYTDTIIEKLPGFTHDGMKRQTLRMLTRANLSSDHLGPLINLCFDWLISPKESVAVKVYSMDILYKISQTEPELKKELADSIEWRLSEETPGFRSRGLKILKKLLPELNSQQQ